MFIMTINSSFPVAQKWKSEAFQTVCHKTILSHIYLHIFSHLKTAAVAVDHDDAGICLARVLDFHSKGVSHRRKFEGMGVKILGRRVHPDFIKVPNSTWGDTKL